jgi:hypothetical protein
MSCDWDNERVGDELTRFKCRSSVLLSYRAFLLVDALVGSLYQSASL